MEFEQSSNGKEWNEFKSEPNKALIFDIGDTLGDEQAARTAGIPFIHAAYGFGTAAHPDATIHDIRELAEVARAITGNGE